MTPNGQPTLENCEIKVWQIKCIATISIHHRLSLPVKKSRTALVVVLCIALAGGRRYYKARLHVHFSYVIEVLKSTN